MKADLSPTKAPSLALEIHLTAEHPVHNRVKLWPCPSMKSRNAPNEAASLSTTSRSELSMMLYQVWDPAKSRHAASSRPPAKSPGRVGWIRIGVPTGDCPPLPPPTPPPPEPPLPALPAVPPAAAVPPCPPADVGSSSEQLATMTKQQSPAKVAAWRARMCIQPFP